MASSSSSSSSAATEGEIIYTTTINSFDKDELVDTHGIGFTKLNPSESTSLSGIQNKIHNEIQASIWEEKKIYDKTITHLLRRGTSPQQIHIHKVQPNTPELKVATILNTIQKTPAILRLYASPASLNLTGLIDVSLNTSTDELLENRQKRSVFYILLAMDILHDFGESNYFNISPAEALSYICLGMTSVISNSDIPYYLNRIVMLFYAIHSYKTTILKGIITSHKDYLNMLHIIGHDLITAVNGNRFIHTSKVQQNCGYTSSDGKRICRYEPKVKRVEYFESLQETPFDSHLLWMGKVFDPEFPYALVYEDSTTNMMKTRPLISVRNVPIQFDAASDQMKSTTIMSQYEIITQLGGFPKEESTKYEEYYTSPFGSMRFNIGKLAVTYESEQVNTERDTNLLRKQLVESSIFVLQIIEIIKNIIASLDIGAEHDAQKRYLDDLYKYVGLTTVAKKKPAKLIKELFDIDYKRFPDEPYMFLPSYEEFSYDMDAFNRVTFTTVDSSPLELNTTKLDKLISEWTASPKIEYNMSALENASKQIDILISSFNNPPNIIYPNLLRTTIRRLEGDKSYDDKPSVSNVAQEIVGDTLNINVRDAKKTKGAVEAVTDKLKSNPSEFVQLALRKTMGDVMQLVWNRRVAQFEKDTSINPWVFTQDVMCALIGLLLGSRIVLRTENGHALSLDMRYMTNTIADYFTKYKGEIKTYFFNKYGKTDETRDLFRYVEVYIMEMELAYYKISLPPDIIIKSLKSLLDEITKLPYKDPSITDDETIYATIFRNPLIKSAFNQRETIKSHIYGISYGKKALKLIAQPDGSTPSLGRKRMPSQTKRRSRKCPRGTIRRKAYKTKRGVTVRSSCIKDRGLPGKGKRLFTLKKGELGKYGYSLKQAREKRRVALNKARKELSHATLVRKINALAILMKNTHPDYSRRARADVKWLGKTRA